MRRARSPAWHARASSRLRAAARGARSTKPWSRPIAGSGACPSSPSSCRSTPAQDESELLGRIYDELGDQPRALEAFRRTLARNPRALEIRERVIRLLAQQGELDAAIAEYRKLVSAAPREPRFVIELSKLLLESGKRDEALRLLDQTGARNPSDARIHRSLLEVYARWNETARATQTLARLSRIEPEDPSHFVALGEQLLEQGDQEGALAVWRKILALPGDKARAHATMATTYLDHDMAARALPEYEAAVKLEPESIEYLRGLAETLEKLQRSSEAAERWQQVLTLTTDRAQKREARRRVVRLWALAGDLPRRIAELERAFTGGEGAAAKPDAEAGRFLAEGYRALASGRRRAQGDPRNLDAAERVLARVLEIEPGDIESMLALERLRTLRGNLSGAIDVLKRLLEADPKNAQAYLTRLSAHSLSLYRDDDAIAFAERLVALNSKDAKGARAARRSYRARQNAERAIASYEQAVALDENAFAVQLDLAELYLARGDARAGHAALARVVRASPDDELVKRAARALIQLDLSAGALGDLEQTLLPLSLGNPQRPIYRAMLVELYDAMTRPLIEAAREDSAEGARARQQLQAIGQRAIKPLLEALADSDDAQRRIAIDLLGQTRNEHAAAALLGAAERDGDVGLRRRALLAAGAVAPDSLARRVAALARVQERRLRDAAAWALARMRGPIAVAELRALCDQQHAGRARTCIARSRPRARRGLTRAVPASAARRSERLRARRCGARARHERRPYGRTGARHRVAHGAGRDRARGRARRSACSATEALAAEPLAEARSRATPRCVAPRCGRCAGWARASRALSAAPEQSEPEERIALEPELSAWLALDPGATVDAALAAFARELSESARAALQGPPATARGVLALLSREDPALAPSEPYPAFRALRAGLAPALAELAQHPDPAVRASALALVASSDAVRRAAFGDRRARRRRRTGAERGARSARRRGRRPTRPPRSTPLGHRRDDARWWMRLRAVNALGRSGGEPAYERLRRVLLADPMRTCARPPRSRSARRAPAARSKRWRPRWRATPSRACAPPQPPPCAASAGRKPRVRSSTLRRPSPAHQTGAPAAN